ncbi:hypothetical protein ACFQXA_05500 [Nocardiopsis composta]
MTSTTSSRPAPRSEAARGGARIALLLGLMVLSPVCAEYLSAYDDSTGNPAALLGALIIFVPLYGAPALLIRRPRGGSASAGRASPRWRPRPGSCRRA